jgi:hypothetical protein
MKTKSPFFASAMALCAAAVLSFTFADSASAKKSAGPTITPPASTEPVQPLPVTTSPVASGTFNGTVME